MQIRSLTTISILLINFIVANNSHGKNMEKSAFGFYESSSENPNQNEPWENPMLEIFRNEKKEIKFYLDAYHHKANCHFNGTLDMTGESIYETKSIDGLEGEADCRSVFKIKEKGIFISFSGKDCRKLCPESSSNKILTEHKVGFSTDEKMEEILNSNKYDFKFLKESLLLGADQFSKVNFFAITKKQLDSILISKTYNLKDRILNRRQESEVKQRIKLFKAEHQRLTSEKKQEDAEEVLGYMELLYDNFGKSFSKKEMFDFYKSYADLLAEKNLFTYAIANYRKAQAIKKESEFFLKIADLIYKETDAEENGKMTRSNRDLAAIEYQAFAKEQGQNPLAKIVIERCKVCGEYQKFAGQKLSSSFIGEWKLKSVLCDKGELTKAGEDFQKTITTPPKATWKSTFTIKAGGIVTRRDREDYCYETEEIWQEKDQMVLVLRTKPAKYYKNCEVKDKPVAIKNPDIMREIVQNGSQGVIEYISLDDEANSQYCQAGKFKQIFVKQ